MHGFYQHLLRILEEETPFALAVITGCSGSSPQKAGAKAAFLADGRIIGTLGGGCLEAEIQDRARRAMHTGEATRFELILDHDFGWDDGLICGGKVHGVILPNAQKASGLWQELASAGTQLRAWGVRDDFQIHAMQIPMGSNPEEGKAASISGEQREDGWLYRESVLPPCQLWVAGSGHVAQAVVPLAQQMDFAVTVFDDRPSLTNHQFFPRETRLEVDHWDNLLQREPLPSPAHTFGLIMTRGHQHDAQVLRHWIQHPFRFLGMIGSKRKARLIFSQFREEKLASEEQLSRVACPVGIDIKAIRVNEIALSIVAQLVRVRAEKVFEITSSPFRTGEHERTKD